LAPFRKSTGRSNTDKREKNSHDATLIKGHAKSKYSKIRPQPSAYYSQLAEPPQSLSNPHDRDCDLRSTINRDGFGVCRRNRFLGFGWGKVFISIGCVIPGDIAATRTTKHVGECIYCHATENLHDEHCIPEALNGTRVLVEGSCGDCGKITSAFESKYARDSMLPVRTAWNMRSKRSKKKRPAEFPMKFIKGGKEKIINVPVADHYSLIPMLELGPPGFYSGRQHKLGLKTGEYKIRTLPIRPDEHIEYLTQKYDADRLSVDFQIDPTAFLRMIGKIAYCTIVWKYGLHNIAEAYIVPAILGKENIWHWVGSDGEPELYETTKEMNTDHIVSTWHIRDGTLLARVKLFKKSPTPEYDVVVGRLSEQAHGLFLSLGRG
jgi:hypothetical protein